ncbi:hypothetical protein WME79_27655 [Sorangium sp. So ce726]|uniref:hypothetical protein n=1 Tax=Sorangium sp. So ce726 TaxID=3133319 RepID=UPI003F5FC58A
MRSRRAESSVAAPSSALTWASWPHACITPRVSDGKSWPDCSLDRERIHVGAEQQGAAGALALEVGDDARPGHARAHRQAELAQALRDDLGRAHLGVAELRVPVNVAPHGDEIAIEELHVPAELIGHAAMPALHHGS